ncbi:hypothetical protein AALB64_18335 [Lachnospiraceae bacterium 45-P1]
MDYYFNESALLQESSPYCLQGMIKEFKELYDKTEKYSGKMWIKETFSCHDLKAFTDFENGMRFALPFQLFGKCGRLTVGQYTENAIEAVKPEVSDPRVRELIYLCNRDENERMISLAEDMSAPEKEYVLQGAALTRVVNLKNAAEIDDYNLMNPFPQSIGEVFERIEKMYPDIVFTKTAYKTAATRESAYRTIGYERLLNIFRRMNETMLPFYYGKVSGKSENDIFQELRGTYNIDISPESRKTMKLYGKQRCLTIDGTEYEFTNHIKFKKDACRIYFRFLEDKKKIYIGHSGKHLDTADG